MIRVKVQLVLIKISPFIDRFDHNGLILSGTQNLRYLFIFLNNMNKKAAVKKNHIGL
jgi:hypothetical protein